MAPGQMISGERLKVEMKQKYEQLTPSTKAYFEVGDEMLVFLLIFFFKKVAIREFIAN